MYVFAAKLLLSKASNKSVGIVLNAIVTMNVNIGIAIREQKNLTYLLCVNNKYNI